MKTNTFPVICTLLAGLFLSACGNDNGGNNGKLIAKFTSKEQQTLQPFPSCSAFKQYATEALILEYTTAYWAGVPCWSCEVAISVTGAPARASLEFPPPGAETDVTASPQPAAGEDSGGGSTRVNDTNSQEAGVDEADRVESTQDGSTMFYLDNAWYGGSQQVLIWDTSAPENTRIIARIDLGNQRYASGIYLDEERQRLLVLNEGGYFFPLASDAAFAPEPGNSSFGSVVQAFDVSNPAAPVAIGRFETDAQIISSRRIEGRLHLVSQFGIPLPAALRDDSDFFRLVYEDYYQAVAADDSARVSRLRSEIEARITAAMATTDVSELLPRNSNADGVLETLACSSIYAPELEQRLGLIQVSSMQTDTTNPLSIGLVNNGWNVYGSIDNLYVSQTSGGWWFDPNQVQQTAIHRFALSPTGAPQYKGSGVVEGWASNSYQFSEFAGHLRIASGLQGAALIGPLLDSEPELLPQQTNLVSVLRLDDDGLNLVATTPTFGNDESIRSTRFLGGRGFVVTFRQIDPLFAFDLADPNAPRIVGELEIPGFSSYIYPLGADRLLTIGRAGGEDGLGIANTFQLQIFDVAGAFDSDPATRLEALAAEPIAIGDDEYAFSTAEYEPLAFNFLAGLNDPTTGTLSIPVQIGSPLSERAFSGFYTYDIDGSNGLIAPLLTINHAVVDSENASECPDGKAPPADTREGPSCAQFAPVLWNEPLRTKIVERTRAGETAAQRLFFTFSSRQLKVDTPDGGAQGDQPESLLTIPYAEG